MFPLPRQGSRKPFVVSAGNGHGVTRDTDKDESADRLSGSKKCRSGGSGAAASPAGSWLDVGTARRFGPGGQKRVAV